MKKVLMLASVASMIDQFNMPNIELLQEMGYEVHVACNFQKGSTCTQEKIEVLKNRLKENKIPYFQIDFSRNILKFHEIIKAYKQVKKLLDQERYHFIHCHSPIGGAVGRVAAHRTKTKVIYTAHGFHFYKGAPLQNWLLYYPVEKFLSRYTDVLITINKEDYHRAKKKFHAKKTCYIPGVGIDVEKIQAVTVDRAQKRGELGVGEDDFLLLSVGELSKRKNHEAVIKALGELKDPNIKYVICGQGPLREHLEKLAERLGVRNQLFLLGFRNDVIEICKSSDVFVFPSLQEGLPVALMEAMACGLPCVVSKIRGNVDLIDEHGGIVFKKLDFNIIKKIKEKKFAQKLMNIGRYNSRKSLAFDLKKVDELMKIIYQEKK